MTTAQPGAHLRLVHSVPSRSRPGVSAKAAERPAVTCLSLDPKRPSLSVRRMSTDEVLRQQDWPKITEQLTAYAYKRTHKRSWDLAQDVAQEAIEGLFLRGGWDPEKEPVIGFLARKVVGIVSNELKRRRTSFEIYVDEDEAAEVPSKEDLPDERLHRARVAAQFHDRLAARLDRVAREQKNKLPARLLQLKIDGVTTAAEQAKALKRDIKDIRDARRVLFYHADMVAKELSLQMDAEDPEDDDAEEAIQ